jgi:putative SOS response-associated peptidase YedK
VILRREDEPIWLDPTITEPEKLLGLLRPFPAELLEAYPVSRLVNSFQNDGSELIRPEPVRAVQQALF